MVSPLVSIRIILYCLFFFFFQAEDGIRDADVTGVQTCALPIFGSPVGNVLGMGAGRALRGGRSKRSLHTSLVLDGDSRRRCLRLLRPAFLDSRSEERRVGKDRTYLMLQEYYIQSM